jgi:16S rRNA (uracil1498-N3)-methyltransferase
LDKALPDQATGVRLFVGPEGGFSEQEIDAAKEAGLVEASLGPSILRTETAALVGATLVLARYGRLG